MPQDEMPPNAKVCPKCLGTKTFPFPSSMTLCEGCKGCGWVIPRLAVPEILREMAKTFEERNAVYGDNFRMVGRVMEVLFPDGVMLKRAEHWDIYHLFELQIVKLTRFAISNLTHIDSVHDGAVYGAMIEAILKEREQNGER